MDNKSRKIVAVFGLMFGAIGLFLIGYFSHWAVSCGVVLYKWSMDIDDYFKRYNRQQRENRKVTR